LDFFDSLFGTLSILTPAFQLPGRCCDRSR